MNKYQRLVYINFLCKPALLLTPRKSHIKVLTQKETPLYIKNSGKALIRLGDGEFRIMLKKRGIEYQKYSDELRKEMLMFMREYKRNDNCGFVLAVPNEPFIREAKWFDTVDDDMILQCFAPYRVYFRKFMNNKRVYGDAFVFQKDNEHNYRELWNGSDYVIFVHNDKKYADSFSRKYNVKTMFVKVAAENSYDKIDETENEIIKLVQSIPKTSKYSVLISADPAAKALVYRLLKKGIISYDTGHCWDEPLEMPSKGE